MAVSPYAAAKRLPNYDQFSDRTSAISGVGIHHNAAVNSWKLIENGKLKGVSANYFISNEGDLFSMVDEDKRAWTSGAAGYPAGKAADMRNVTYEVSNSPEGVNNGTWEVSEAALTTLILSIADVYHRHNLGPVARGKDKGVGVHQDWVPTACPGPYIMAKLDSIIVAAEAKRQELIRASSTPSNPNEGDAPVAILKNHPGKWLRDDAAASLARFEAVYGVQPITSAGRTRAEQQALINRWNRGGAANRPPNLYQPAGVNVSRHVINGGTAIDTSNPSVFHSHGAEYGWRFLFAYDKVHFEYDPAYDKHKGGASSGGASSGGLKYSATVANQQAWLNKSRGEKLVVDGLAGPAYKAAVKRYQAFLKVGVDGIWGAGTQAAHQRYYDSFNKPSTPEAPAYPLANGSYFGPKSGPAASVSGYFGHREDLKKWQQQMKNRGWDIAVDGLYGDGTKRIAIAFQKEKGLNPDGLIGRDTWNAAWNAKIT